MIHLPQPLQPLSAARPLKPGLDWYAVLTKPMHEIKAAHWLESNIDGSMTLTPMETRRKSKRGNKGDAFKGINATYQVPRIPRIVFCGFADHPNWLAIWKSHHIIAAISIKKEPQRISATQIERFISHTEEDRLKAGLPVLKVGSAALFTGSGIFHGHMMEIANLGPSYAEVWQEFFGAKRLVKVSKDNLEAA